MKRLGLIIVGGLAVVVPGAALGALAVEPKVETEATLSENARRATVTALLTCDEVQRARVRITVTQAGRRTVAEGRRKLRCTTDAGEFPVRVKARGGTLQAGAATACALAVTRDDTRQWCKDISLTD